MYLVKYVPNVEERAEISAPVLRNFSNLTNLLHDPLSISSAPETEPKPNVI